MWRLIICPRIGCCWSGTFSPQVAEAAFHLWGLPDVGLLASSHSTQYQHYYTLESLLPLEALGLNAFNHL